MKPHIFFLHTIRGVEDLFNSLCRDLVHGDFDASHIVDESLIRRILAAGGLTKETRRRLCENAVAAEQAGADVIQMTCSTVTPAVPLVRSLVDIPVLSVDEAMVKMAVERYGKIGVIATNPATLTPSTKLVRLTAARSGRDVEVDSVLCEGAYEALLWGDAKKHDSIVLEHLRSLIGKVEVVLLAQASMTRIAGFLEQDEKTVPILSSPQPAVEELARQVKSLKQEKQ